MKIGLFDIWHFLYLFVALGTPVLVALLLRNSNEDKKKKAIRVFAYLTIGLYIADFFIMPLSDSYSGISEYKLPFNVCTVMAVLVPFAEFNKRFARFKRVIVTLSVTTPLMWMVYPGTALGGQPPFSYIIFQTFMYHGFLFGWGFLNLAIGDVVLYWKKIWHELCFILGMLVWAAFGNAVYPGEQNWFFIEKSIFPFLTDEIMPPVVIFCVFGSCFIVYCGYFAIRALLRGKKERNKEEKVEALI